MNDIWKVWQQVSPREAILLWGSILVIGSFLIHVMVMTASDRYAAGLLGAL